MKHSNPQAEESREAKVHTVALGFGDEDLAHRPGLLRLLTDFDFLMRSLRYLLKLPNRMDTEDRRILEQVVFPWFSVLPEVRSILFVGCDWYTRHYERSYFRGKDYWTVEPDPAHRKFAGKQHVVASLEQIDKFFPSDRFDLIVCNGVYGWGLNDRENIENAFGQCWSRLKPGGCFILGWDNIPARTPVPLDQLSSLRVFDHLEFPPLSGWRYETATPYRHTFDFYRKN